MKSFNYLNSIPLILVLFFFACSHENDAIETKGSGNIKSNTQSLNSFTEIEIENNCDVELVKGTENKVEFSDYENIIQYLKFELVGNKLIVKTAPDNISINNSKAKAKIYVKGNLNKIFILGSANVDLVNSFSGLNELSITGSGNLNALQNIVTPNIDCSISGSGNMNILKINAANAKCSVSGSGEISIHVTKSLNASISGSGTISYQGNPSLIQNMSGSGSIVKL